MTGTRANWVSTVDLAALRRVAGGLAETPGQLLAARICDAVLTGITTGKPAELHPDDLRELARALLVLAMPGSRSTRKALTLFGRRLGVRRKQGRKPLTDAESEPLIASVLAVLTRERELTDGYVPERTAHAQAVREVAEAEGVSVRAMQSRCARFGVAFAHRLRPDDATRAGASDDGAALKNRNRAA